MTLIWMPSEASPRGNYRSLTRGWEESPLVFWEIFFEFELIIKLTVLGVSRSSFVLHWGLLAASALNLVV